LSITVWAHTLLLYLNLDKRVCAGYTEEMEDIVQLAITMTEMDTGLELSLTEREAMKQRILARLENTDR
jgi:hypothetical protein